MSETKSVYTAYQGNTYLFGGNAPYVEEMYENYLANPGSVPDSWREYFDALQHVPAANAFQLLLPPTLFSLVGGVHEFGAQCAAISCAQCIEQFAQGHGVFTKEGVAGVKHSFLVSIGEAIKRRIEFWNVGTLCAL